MSDGGPIQFAKVAASVLSQLLLSVHSGDVHQCGGLLCGYYQHHSVKSDNDHAEQFTRLVITAIVPSTKGTDGRDAKDVIGVLSCRRRSPHQLTWKEDTQLRSLGEKGILLLVTEEETETGLHAMHYTLFQGGVVPTPVTLKLENLVSTAGAYEALVNMYGADDASVAPDGAATFGDASAQLTKAIDDSTSVIHQQLEASTVTTADLWQRLADGQRRADTLRDSLKQLQREANELEFYAS